MSFATVDKILTEQDLNEPNEESTELDNLNVNDDIKQQIEQIKEDAINKAIDVIEEEHESYQRIKTCLRQQQNIERIFEFIDTIYISYNLIKQYGISRPILDLIDPNNKLNINLEHLTDTPIFGPEYEIACEGVSGFFGSIYNALKKAVLWVIDLCSRIFKFIFSVISRVFNLSFEPAAIKQIKESKSESPEATIENAKANINRSSNQTKQINELEIFLAKPTSIALPVNDLIEGYNTAILPIKDIAHAVENIFSITLQVLTTIKENTYIDNQNSNFNEQAILLDYINRTTSSYEILDKTLTILNVHTNATLSTYACTRVKIHEVSGSQSRPVNISTYEKNALLALSQAIITLKGKQIILKKINNNDLLILENTIKNTSIPKSDFKIEQYKKKFETIYEQLEKQYKEMDESLNTQSNVTIGQIQIDMQNRVNDIQDRMDTVNVITKTVITAISTFQNVYSQLVTLLSANKNTYAELINLQAKVLRNE
jgi:hypothetical protein